MSFRALAQAGFQGYQAFQDQQDRELQRQVQQQQIQMRDMQIQEQRSALQEKQTMQNMLKEAFSQEDQAATEPEQLQQKYMSVANKALKLGQPDTAKQFIGLAEHQQKVADQRKQQLLEDRQIAKEDVAQAALNLGDNPSPEKLQDLQVKLLRTGSFEQIPPVGTPEFKIWSDGLAKAALSSKDRIQQQIREKELANQAAEKEKERQLRAQERLEDKREAAADRASDRAFKLQLLQMQQAGKTEPGFAVQQRGAQQVTSAAGETLRSINTVGAFMENVTGTQFAHIADKSFTEANIKSFANRLTSPQSQAYNAAISGLGLEVAQAMTGGTGRAPTQALIGEMQDALGAKPGDTPFVVAYKLAQAAEMVKVRLESTPSPKDPKVAAANEKYMKELEAIPKPADLIRLANKNPKLWGEKADTSRTMLQKIGEMQRRIVSDPNFTQTWEQFDAEQAAKKPKAFKPTSEQQDLVSKYAK